MEDAVDQFTVITGTAPAKASQYLYMAEGNIQQALDLFYANDGADLELPAASTQPPRSTPRSHPPTQPPNLSRFRENEDGVIEIDSDENPSEEEDAEMSAYNINRTRRESGPEASRSGARTPASGVQPPSQPARGLDDDEAMARRLQEEYYGGGEASAARDVDGVRAPIGRTTETLVGPGSYIQGDPDDVQGMLENLRRRNRHEAQGPGRPGIFNQQPTSSSIWNDADGDPDTRRRRLAQATAGASEASSKSNLLAEMYRPPFEIMSRLSWDEARQDGRDSEKWILVNVQDPAIFDCQILNRDIWKNQGIKDTVKENFLFMQYNKDDPQGSQYIQYYFQARDNQEAYPHIAIVDPRTGEQVKVWSGPPAPKAMDFLMQLHEFLDRYSLNVTAKNPVAKRKPESRKDKKVEAMTEEEMLEMALQNSLAGNGTTREDDPDDLTRSVGDLKKGKTMVEEDAGGGVLNIGPIGSNGHPQISSSNATPFASISSSSPHTEPPPDPSTTTRIQFRHPDGRVVRRFWVSDPVKRIFEWLKARPMEGREGVDFELIFDKKNLIEVLEDTIAQVGLKNGTVMVEYPET